MVQKEEYVKLVKMDISWQVLVDIKIVINAVHMANTYFIMLDNVMNVYLVVLEIWKLMTITDVFVVKLTCTGMKIKLLRVNLCVDLIHVHLAKANLLSDGTSMMKK